MQKYTIKELVVIHFQIHCHVSEADLKKGGKTKLVNRIASYGVKNSYDALVISKKREERKRERKRERSEIFSTWKTRLRNEEVKRKTQHKYDMLGE